MFDWLKNLIMVKADSVVVNTPKMYVSRSLHGFSDHLMSGRADINALCGQNTMAAGREITVAEIKQGWGKQHKGWHWCYNCVDAFAGEQIENWDIGEDWTPRRRVENASESENNHNSV